MAMQGRGVVKIQKGDRAAHIACARKQEDGAVGVFGRSRFRLLSQLLNLSSRDACVSRCRAHT
eukprot:scaffold14518_cov141-Isochrysis_galbana.AAC.3